MLTLSYNCVKMAMELDELAVDNFRNYLKIPSVQPNVDYSECIPFLTNLAKDIGLQTQVIELTEGKPILILTVPGKRPELGSIVLNSHMDVVPVYPDLWNHDPFGGEIDADGNIYGRGAQDTKGSGIQFLEATRRLILEGQTFLRTIHILFVPDEEDGIDGMEQLVTSSYFKDLNIAFTIDEGESNPGEEFNVYYAEKAIWQATFVVSGTAGHGSLVLPDTAGEKLRRLIDRVMDFRQAQINQLNENPSLVIGQLTFVNLTMLEGGVAPNVVPADLSVTFDFRLAVDEDHEKFEALLQSWCEEAGGNIEIKFTAKEPATPPTPIDASNPFWVAMESVFNEIEQPIITKILAGGTDSRFLRRVGIPCICFSPMNNTPDLAHANNEFLNKSVFLKGIYVFKKLIPALANVPSEA